MTNQNRQQDFGRDDKPAQQQQQTANKQPGRPNKGEERDPSRNPSGSPEMQQGGQPNPGQQHQQGKPQERNPQQGNSQQGDQRQQDDRQGLNRQNDPQDAQRRSGMR